MSERRLVVFRSRLRPGVEAEYGAHAERIARLAVKMPGFVSAKDFVADDGERVALIEWDSPRELAIWRDELSHVDAQRAGRDRYYASYDLRVCRELHGARFDAATGTHTAIDRDPAKLRGIAERWLSCFEHRELDGLLALYADDATHSSPKIRARHPERGGLLRGKAALRAYVHVLHDQLTGTSVRATSVTITKGIGSGPRFEAAVLAQAYLDLHNQPQTEWQPELVI